MILTRVEADRAGRRLAEAVSGQVRLNEPMSRHTTFRIGGPAALYVECDTVADLHRATDILLERGIEWRVVGKCSNLVVSDAGFDGAVLVLGRDFRHFSVDGGMLQTGSAVLLARLVQHAFSVGLSGLEFAVGIPGTVGGALVMNAGSRDDWIDSIVERVTVFLPGEGLSRLRRSDVNWGYRETNLRPPLVLVEASLRLNEGDRERIRWAMERSLSRRKSTQPLAMPSAGSVFKNPPGRSAGQLVDSVGLRGASVGGAQISEVHANFIVNCGRARACDVAALVEEARTRVREAHGVELETEIEFLGPVDRS